MRGRQPGRPAPPRRPTREVRVGSVAIGSGSPIRVQSMTTTPTADARATAEQATRLAEAGCEIVRVTVPTTADADAVPEIRRILRARRIDVPLVADIHFTPAVAMRVVPHVDKVRVNPGNFADKKRFAMRLYTDAEYDAEIERIEAVFGPLVDRCRDLGVAMRIGTNHGSLSDRILNRHGDTPEGMVESALEFVRICERRGFRDVVLSMKASNPVVVLQAYRLLVRRADAEGFDLPLHLGVTEAGDGEDARIKSAIGIGALLDDGIGDTIRVSLTEDPVAEIPVARALVAPYNAARAGGRTVPSSWVAPEIRTAGARRVAREVEVGAVVVGGHRPPAVEAALGGPDVARAHTDAGVPAAEIVSFDVAGEADAAAIETTYGRRDERVGGPAVSVRLRSASEDGLGPLFRVADRVHVEVGPAEDDARVEAIASRCLEAGIALLVEGSDAGRTARAVAAARRVGLPDVLASIDPCAGRSTLESGRALAAALDVRGLDAPVVLIDRPGERDADPVLGPSQDLGGLLCEGIGDAVRIEHDRPDLALRLAWGILQASRTRMTRTEFISCPSCGRTLFDLEETTARIKRRTAHLDGVKIAVMGCIVNGPGEMADADFGYVGWGPGRIALFVGREMVERDVPTAEADERLVRLIREHGRWKDPPARP